MAQFWSAVVAAVVSLIVAAGGWVLQSRRLRAEHEAAAEARRHELERLQLEFEQQRQISQEDADRRMAAERRETNKATVRYILKELPDKKFRSLRAIRVRLGSEYGDEEVKQLLRDVDAVGSQTNSGADTDLFFLPDHASEA